MTDKPENSLDEVVRADGRYPLDAFAFLHDGLARAVKDAYADEPEEPEQDQTPHRRPRHVSGEQLCEAMRAEAIERWGMLAQTVLTRWNIVATDDFGNMVYLLVENDLMQKTDADSIDDFHDVYDFRSAFGPDGVFEAEP